MNLVTFKVLLSYIKALRFDVLKKTFSFIRLVCALHREFAYAPQSKQRSKIGKPL